MAEKFWIIWNPQSPKPPRRKFASEQEAEDVAKKMVEQYHQSFIVMESRHGYEVAPPRRVGYLAKPKKVKKKAAGVELGKVNANWDTYKGWRTRGRQVKFGEKSAARDKDGRCLFTLAQTEPVDERYRGRL